MAGERLSDVDIVCYQKNHDVGVTWLENRYAGCACDIPSVDYQYSWKPAIWWKYFSKFPEIWQYNRLGNLYTWVRSPTWITAGFAQEFAGKDGKNFYCELTLSISVG